MFVVVSQALIDTGHSTVICAPVYSSFAGLSTQVPLGIDEGLKHDSSIHCDALMSLRKSSLTHYVGRLPAPKLRALNNALKIALALDEP